MLHIQQAFSESFAESLVKRALETEFVPSSVYPAGGDSSSGTTRDSYRTSTEMTGGLLLDRDIEKLINRKLYIAANSFDIFDYTQEKEQWNIIRYTEGQKFKLHTDCWDTVEGEGKDQRILTVMIVLKQAGEGGETVFPNLGLSIRPPAGTMLTWRNTLDGKCNRMLMHAGHPPRSGEKIIMTKWYRGISYE